VILEISDGVNARLGFIQGLRNLREKDKERNGAEEEDGKVFHGFNLPLCQNEVNNYFQRIGNNVVSAEN